MEELESALLVSDAALDAYIAGGDARHRARSERAREQIPGALEHVTQHVTERAPATKGCTSAAPAGR